MSHNAQADRRGRKLLNGQGFLDKSLAIRVVVRVSVEVHRRQTLDYAIELAVVEQERTIQTILVISRLLDITLAREWP